MTLRGIKFPFTISASRGGALTSEEIKQIESDLYLLLVTEPGSRAFRREYGVGISLFLQEPNDDILLALLRRRIIEGVVMFEPRISINDIQFAVKESTLTIIVSYEVQSTGQHNSSQFSFPRS